MRPRAPWRSLTGRLALVTAAALLVAQAASFALLARAQDQAATLRAASNALFVIEAAAGEVPVTPRERRRARFARRRVDRAEAPPDGERLYRAERTLRAELAGRAAAPRDLRVLRTGRRAPRGPREALTVAVLTEGGWLSADAPLPPRRPARLAPLIVQTGLIYLALLVPVLWIGRQVSRPLAQLTADAADYRVGDAPSPRAGGPEDVAALSRAVAAMQARIAEGLAERDAMLGAIGHDLRTPLTSLRLRAEQVTDEALREKMTRTLARAEALLEDTLTLARSGHLDGEPVPTDLGALARDVASAARAAGQRVTLGPLEPVTAPVHEGSLSRALANLIENADRYAGGGTVTLRRAGDEAVLAVTDEGPGLPGGFAVGAFSRGEGSRNTGTGGAGLGLAIARRVAEAHGGRLDVTPRPGGGTTATIRVPT